MQTIKKFRLYCSINSILLVSMSLPSALLSQPQADADVSTSSANLPSEIGIEQVIQLSLANQFSISISKVQYQQAVEQEAVSKEALETQVNVSASAYRDSNSNPNSFPYSVEGTQQQVGVSKNFATGTNVEVSLSSDRFKDRAIPRSGEASLTVNQNLLRGRSRDYNLAPIRIAGKRAEQSFESMRQTVIDTVTGAQYAYYDALLADANLQVSKESLTLAQRLLSENKKRSEIGSIAESDILQAEAEVAARQDRVYQAEATLVRARNLLKSLLSNNGRDILFWDFSMPLPSQPELYHHNLDQGYEQALANRPDYRQAVLNMEIGDIEKLRASHATLPNLDLYFRMNMEGWGDSTEGTFNDVNSDKSPDYTVGLRLSRSVTNRAAKARKSIAYLEYNRRHMSLLELEQAILLDLHSAGAQIEANWKRLESARKGRELAERSLKAEQKRFQTGTSSTFILIRLQTDLDNAKIRELVAANDYRKSVVEWDRLTGTILSKHAIQL